MRTYNWHRKTTDRWLDRFCHHPSCSVFASSINLLKSTRIWRLSLSHRGVQVCVVWAVIIKLEVVSQWTWMGERMGWTRNSFGDDGAHIYKLFFLCNSFAADLANVFVVGEHVILKPLLLSCSSWVAVRLQKFEHQEEIGQEDNKSCLYLLCNEEELWIEYGVHITHYSGFPGLGFSNEVGFYWKLE